MASKSDDTPWVPGHRKIPNSLRPQGFHRHVLMSLLMADIALVMYEGNTQEVSELYRNRPEWKVEDGISKLLSIKYGTYGSGVLLDLTRLNETELDKLKEYLIEAIESARPEVQRRDREAQEAEASGDYSYERSHRGDARLVRRSRPVE